MTEIRKLIADYAAGAAKLKRSVRGLKKTALDFRPFDGAWTIREHLVHLADMETNGYVRFRCIVAESGKAVMLVDEEKWTANIGYGSASAEDYLSLFVLLRKLTASYLKTRLGDAELWEKNHIVHPERGNITLKDWIKLFAAHADIHVKYIERNKGIWKKSRAGKRAG